MNVNIICVGKLKEKFFSAAAEEYAKRLSRYIKLNIIEVADEKCPEGISTAMSERIKALEGTRIESKLKGGFTIALDIKGERLDSVGFAALFERLAVSGDTVNFVIGGSLGLAGAVTDKADMLLSFSDMTFPHQLMRVILLEQVYRAQRIIKNEPYHK